MARDPFADLEPLVQRVYAYVAYRLGDGYDAEQITTATFERAFRHRAAFDPETDEPVPFLVGLARHLIQERRPSGGGDGYLADTERELIGLRYGADLTPIQAAALLDLDPQTVEDRTRAVLAKLQDPSDGP